MRFKFKIIISLFVFILTSCIFDGYRIENKSFCGRIDTIYKTSPCFVNLVLSNNKPSYHDTIDVCYCGFNSEFWNTIKKGDTVIKVKGSRNIILLVKHKPIEFNYPYCGH
jgi:hypothetical protein